MTDTEELRDIAPSGTLRGGVVVAPAMSVSFAIKHDGQLRGVPVDLLRALSEMLGLPLAIAEFPNSGALTDAVAAGACDVAFMPRDAAREARVAFGPTFYDMATTYLVPAGSTITSIDAVNREGVRIIAIANTTTARSARRTAPLASVEEVPTVDQMTEMASRCDGDAFALSQDSFVGLLPQLPGARVLDGSFQQTGVAVAVPKDRPSALRLITRLMAEAKSSGRVRAALDAAGFHKSPVAGA